MGCFNTKIKEDAEKKLIKEKKIMIIFYSMYGHVEKLAREILKGVNSVPGFKGELWYVEETLSEEGLKKMGALTELRILRC